MNRTALLAALAVALMGIALFGLYMQRFEAEATGGEKIAVLMATRDIPIGEPLTRDALAVKRIPEAYIEDRHIHEADLSQVLGVKLSTSVHGGQSVLWTDLATANQERRELSQLLREGMRALTIRASKESSFGGLLRAGDRVDVLLTAQRPGGSEEVTVPMLQNVLVLAVGEDTGGPDQETPRGGRARGREVSLAVTVEQAALLTHAEERGDLALILRNPEDLAILEGIPETTATDLMEPAHRRRVQRRRPVEEITRIERVE